MTTAIAEHCPALKPMRPNLDYFRGKHVIVTGGTGFIGRHLTDALQAIPGIGKITSLGQRQFNVTDITQTALLMTMKNPDIIFHLAGMASPGTDEKDWPQLWNTNVNGTYNVVHCAPQGCRVVFASSIVVYGDWLMQLHEGPSSEKYTETHSCEPTSLYGVSKLAAEKVIDVYTTMQRISGISLRLCATVGKGATHGVLPAFIDKVKRNEPTFKMLGEKPGSIKPYMHIDDTVQALINAASSGFEMGAINVVPADSLSIEAIADMVLHTLTPNKTWIKHWLGTNFQGDNPLLRIDNAMTNQLVNLRYKTSDVAVMQAIKDMVTL